MTDNEEMIIRMIGGVHEMLSALTPPDDDAEEADSVWHDLLAEMSALCMRRDGY
jgi:hypothetical protein